MEVDFAQQRKRKKGKRTNGRHGKRENRYERMISCKKIFHCDVVSSLCCSPLSKGCLQVQMVVLSSSYFFFLHCSKLQHWFVLHELLISYSLPFLSFYSHFSCGFLVIPFILVLRTRFNVSSSMLLFSIYKFFKFKWWYHDHLAILNIAISFINDLFFTTPIFHLAFVMILPWF